MVIRLPSNRVIVFDSKVPFNSYIDSLEATTEEEVNKFMKVHLERILNYFTSRVTNARAEGINSKIALIGKMAFGYRNKEHLKTVLSLNYQ